MEGFSKRGFIKSFDGMVLKKVIIENLDGRVLKKGHNREP